MAGNAGAPAWTPERYKQEVDLIVVEMAAIPANQKLGYFKGRIAGFPEPYRGAAQTILLEGRALVDNPQPTGPLAFLREAIQAVPSVKYAIGVGGIVSVIAIVASFGIGYRVAVIGFPIILILMILLVIFSKLASASPQYFLYPLIILTWFAIFAMIATIGLIFTGVFFKWPLDLHYWLVKG